MKALIRQEGDVFVIHLKGKVDFDSTEPFRNTVLSHLKNQKVVFNLTELDFVGSNGITPFVKTLEKLCSTEDNSVHFCNISSEFQRIFEASRMRGLKIFENEVMAKTSFYRVFDHSAAMPQITYNSVEVAGSEGESSEVSTVASTPDCTSAIKD